MSDIYNNEIKKLFKELSTSPNGLSSTQAERNKIRYGANIIAQSKRENFFHKFIKQFKNAMVLVLLVSAIVSLAISIFHKEYSDLFEGLLILGIVVINALVGAIQERKAENTLALLEKQTQAHARVYRDGELTLVDFSEVVVGDIVELKNGDIISADIRLMHSNNLACDESKLTGESKKAKKDANAKSTANNLLSDRKNMCFKSTTIVSGNATGVVVGTGKNTEIGKIANLISTNTKQKSPLEKNIDKIGKAITVGVSVIVVVVFIVQLLFSNKINIGDAFMTAIALAVAAIPESLPAVITIIMALGVQKLAKHNAIVKSLSSVETLGCCNCICTDKTGTLTTNQMTVVHIFTSGNVYAEKDFKNKRLDLDPTFKISALCSNAKLDNNSNLVGDATEKALYEFCTKCDYDIMTERHNNKRLVEFPFDSSKKYMAVITTGREGHKNAYIKGAYDILIKKCTKILMHGQVVALTDKHKEQIKKAHNSFSKQAERVIMMALGDPIGDTCDENNLIFVSLAGIIDPPRKESLDSIKQCHTAGLTPIMITGDHKETAYAIAKQLTIARSITEVITGSELDSLSDSDFEKVVHKFRVFARVSPAHKSKIVKALKKRGNIVAMTGDGVNDAPSIKESDIGTCMGSGTDVTKSVSDLIISDDNFSTIVLAVAMGRTIYNNIQKTLQFLISTNAVEVLGLFVVSLVMRDSVFLLPSQILFINLITDSLPAFALGIEPPEKNIMNKPPRNTNQSIFHGEIGTAIIYQAFIQTFIVLILFVWSYHTYGNSVATTMSFVTICLMQILHAINCKTNKSLFSINILQNKFFNFSFLALLALILAVSLIPSLQIAFNIVPMTGYQWLIVVLSSVSIIPLVEIFKLILSHKPRSDILANISQES